MSFGVVQAEKVTTESGYSLGAGNASSFKNRIINGGMQFNQRYGSTAFTNAATNEYSLDRWSCYGTNASKFTIQRSTTAPAGFTYSLLVTSLAATTPGSTDIYIFRQYIEGNNVADLGWGSASAKPITVSFWARSSVTGTYACIIKNGAENRSYGFTYTINAADTFEYKTVTIQGDTTGGWSTDTALGMQIVFSLGAGASAGLISAGSWQSTNAWGVTGQSNLITTSGATLYISGVQIEVGTVATSWDFRSYGTELALCQRYYVDLANNGGSVQNTYRAIGFASTYTTTAGTYITQVPVPMRILPSLTQSGTMYLQNLGTTSVSSFAGPYSMAGTVIEGDLTMVGAVTANITAILRWNNSSTQKFAYFADF